MFQGATDPEGRPLTAYDYIRHHLPHAQINALLHATAILDGHVMIWPDPKLSKRGRWWLKVRQLWKRGTDPAARGTPTTFRKMMREWDEEAMTNA